MEISGRYVVADCSDEWWDKVLRDIMSGPHHSGFAMISLGLHVFNPYPLLSNGEVALEPYGFPFEYSQNPNTHGSIAFVEKGEPSYSREILKNLNGTSQTCYRGAAFLSSEGKTKKVLSNTSANDEQRTLVTPSHAYTPLVCNLVREQTLFFGLSFHCGRCYYLLVFLLKGWRTSHVLILLRFEFESDMSLDW